MNSFYNNIWRKLAIGTVQFGINYGINNKTGIIKDDDLMELLSYANDNDINVLDTAFNYGNSEKRLGEFLKEDRYNFKVITKLPKGTNSKNIFEYFNISLKNLNATSIYGYLIHDFKDYLNDKKLFQSLSEIKQNKLAEKIGFSLYHPEELEIILNDKIEFDLIQLPYNLCDRRFEEYFLELKNKNIEIHTRSVFLQGLFFMEPNKLSSKLKPFSTFIKKNNEIKKLLNKSMETIALNFVLQNELIDKVVIGLDNTEQLIKNITASKILLTNDEQNFIHNEILKIEIPRELLIPSNWK